ncbi:MAG: uncharacterized protein KVP18_004321 [Porospora cf. gigantea A]|uniref:uncharacterized protein n=1 Tax=Porospora cf. gigantea A TaxID=2853593 RepID=UPI00355A7D27|nr:MAG: hypothetical protein KVP18_004321 [Porospora cf. gigantea A]
MDGKLGYRDSIKGVLHAVVETQRDRLIRFFCQLLSESKMLSRFESDGFTDSEEIWKLQTRILLLNQILSLRTVFQIGCQITLAQTVLHLPERRRLLDKRIQEQKILFGRQLEAMCGGQPITRELLAAATLSQSGCVFSHTFKDFYKGYLLASVVENPAILLGSDQQTSEMLAAGTAEVEAAYKDRDRRPISYGALYF